MNVIFVTMGSMYTPYLDTYFSIKDKLDKVGFYVSDKFFFEKNFKSDEKVKYLKEWEITEKLSETPIDRELIEELEEKYFKDESFWNAPNNDRRIFLGKYTKYTQDYSPSYEYEGLLKLCQLFTKNIEAFIEDINPDLIVGITPSTIGDYLFYRIAKAKGIHYRTLKTVKVGNYQTFTETISEEHEHIKETFESYMSENIIDKEIEEKAEDFLKKFESGNTAYEGNVAIPKTYKVFTINYLKNYLKYVIKDILTLKKKRDSHNQTLYSYTYLLNNPIKSFKAKQFKSFTKSRTIFELDKIEKGNYIFFPLHAEPEIAITNYAKNYQNQIEVIRNIALQLPSKYKLIVKEHPRNIGRRSLGYYRKILDIPNVDFVDFDLPSIEVVKRSNMIIVLSGNIGFEAVLNGIPVISLGKTMYNMLPKTMVNYLDNIKDIYTELERTIDNHNYSRDILKKYVSAVIKNSFPLDLYTVLLQKAGREGGSDYSRNIYDENIEELSINILKFCEKEKNK